MLEFWGGSWVDGDGRLAGKMEMRRAEHRRRQGCMVNCPDIRIIEAVRSAVAQQARLRRSGNMSGDGKISIFLELCFYEEETHVGEAEVRASQKSCRRGWRLHATGPHLA